MIDSFAEARAQILSLRPGQLRGAAAEVRDFGGAAVTAGDTMRASADRLGARRGSPYQAYDERVTPTAGWMAGLARPSSDTAASLDDSAAAAERAQMVLAQQEEALARYGSNPGTTPEAFAAAQAQAAATLERAIAEVTAAYGGIAPPPTTAAPVVAGGGAGTRAGAATGAGTGAGAGPSGGVAATTGAAGGARGALGPTSGPFAGFVADPTTGNLVDPGTGRQVDAGGRFLDPITGQPFGPASPDVTRLEGLDGGIGPVGVLPGAPGTGAAGVSDPGGAGAVAGSGGAFGLSPLVAAGLGGAAAIAAGAGVFAATGGRGAARGTGFFAGLYGGAVPPSLAGDNPAAAQLREKAAQNLATSAGTAQRYAAIASGQAPGAYLPPLAGGVAGGTGRRDRRRTAGTPPTGVEDAAVWNGGGAVPPRLDR